MSKRKLATTLLSTFATFSICASLVLSSTTAGTAGFSPKIPIKLPVAQSGSITFENAESNIQQIPQVAWENIKASVSNNKQTTVKTVLEVGPHTQTTIDRLRELLNDEYKLFAGFSQPTAFLAIAYSAKDESWAEKEFPILVAKEKVKLGNYPYVSRIKGNCGFDGSNASECWGGMSFVLPGYNYGFGLYGVQDPFWSVSSTQAGPVSQVVHEYTHNVQFAQWIGSKLAAGENVRSDSAHRNVPCWFAEGQANAIGIGIASSNIAMYKEARSNSVLRAIDSNKPVKPTLSAKTLTASNLTQFLTGQKTPSCYNPGTNGDYQLGYSIGYAATEILIAVGGPQATMALVAETAAGKTWSQAFKLVYGRSWETTAPLIAKALAAEYSAEPMN